MDVTLIFIKNGSVKLYLFFSVYKSHLNVPGLSPASRYDRRWTWLFLEACVRNCWSQRLTDITCLWAAWIRTFKNEGFLSSENVYKKLCPVHNFVHNLCCWKLNLSSLITTQLPGHVTVPCNSRRSFRKKSWIHKVFHSDETPPAVLCSALGPTV